MLKRYLFMLPIGAMIFAAMGHAAVPPLTEEQRWSMSTHIFAGQVISDTSREVQSRGGTDTVHSARVKVTMLMKGDFLMTGSEVRVGYWRKFPKGGWTGNTGQRDRMRGSQKVMVYATHAGDDSFELLNPNGFSEIKGAE